MGLQLDEVDDHPLVKQTIAAFRETMAEDYSDPDLMPEEEFHAQLANPTFKALADMDELDPLSAAVLSTAHLSPGAEFARVKPRLDKEVADVLEELDVASTNPSAIFTSSNPKVLKLIVAAIAAATTSDDLKELVGGMAPRDVAAEMSDTCNILCELGEHLAKTGLWREMPPKLLDKYFEGLDTVAGFLPGTMFKRVLNLVAQDLKTEIARGTAADMAEKTAAPQVDPDSPFEQLKGSARKFKPGM